MNIPSSSLFVKIDHFFWKTPTDSHSSSFLWIMWYIWKAQNDKIHEKIDRETLKLAENEANAWILIQMDVFNDLPSSKIAGSKVINSTRYRCFIDGSWKESTNFSGLGWFCILPDDDEPTMGAANLRRSLTSLHPKVEALVWVMRCMIGQEKREVSFFTDCSDLEKMVSSPRSGHHSLLT